MSYAYLPTGSSHVVFNTGNDDYTSIPDDYTGVVLSTKKAFSQEVLDVTLPDMFNELELDYSYNPYDNSITISSRKSNLSSSAESILTDLTSSSVDTSNVFTRDSNPSYFDESKFYNHMYEVSQVVNSNLTDTQKNNELSSILYSEPNYDYKKSSIGKADSSSDTFESSSFHFLIDKPNASKNKTIGYQVGTYYHTAMDLGTFYIEQYINGSKYGSAITDTLETLSQFEQTYRRHFNNLRGVCNSRDLIDAFKAPVVPPPKPPDKRIPTTCCILVECYPDLYKYPWEV